MEMQQSIQQSEEQLEKRRSLSAPVTLLLLLSLSLLIMAAWCWVGFGSIRGATGYYLRGQTLLADSTEKSFGVAAPGDRVRVTFKLTNCGPKPIRVLGCFSPCGCMVLDHLPFTLDKNASREFGVSIEISKQERARSMYSRLEILLFTDNPSQSRIPLIVRGDVTVKSKG
jgi:hypothetical protein